MNAYLALGSNLGDRHQNLLKAVEHLNAVPGLKIIGFSSIYETEPVGKTDQPSFLNAAVKISTTLAVKDLLAACLKIENILGRQRIERWGPRTIDIDILFYGDMVICEHNIVVPHPRLHERAFVLAPLVEIAPEMKHPLIGKTMTELIQGLDQTGITRTDCKLKD